MALLWDPEVHLNRIFAFARELEKDTETEEKKKYWQLIAYIDAQSGGEILS